MFIEDHVAMPAALLRRAVAEVMEIVREGQEGRGADAAPRFVGRLRTDSRSAYAYVAPRFHDQGYTALLRDEPEGATFVAMPGIIVPSASRLWVALLLFALTVMTTIMTGGLEVVNEQMRFNLVNGLGFSAALLGILGAHEMGHFLVARRFGVATSYPFFIPMPPIFLLGTMGAFISIKEPPRDRTTILAIGIAGPIAGLVVAIPVMILGLWLSEVKQVLPGSGSFTEGNSLVYAALKIAVFGRFLPANGQDVFLHPVALAGWGGLLVTGLNLLPAGQLDGGHIFFALFGPRLARITTMAIALLLLGMGFLWNGWFIWAALIAFLGRQRAPLLDEISPLEGGWRWLALFGLLLFVLTFIPVPITLNL